MINDDLALRDRFQALAKSETRENAAASVQALLEWGIRASIERLLQPGEQQTVTVRREMVLTAGDASAIALQFNGADGRALGKAGEVVTTRVNLANFKEFLQARMNRGVELFEVAAAMADHRLGHCPQGFL